MLLDEVEPDGGLVGDVLDHPVYAVLHCAATTSPQGICKKEKKNTQVSEVLDWNPHQRSENETGGGRLVAWFTAEEAVGGGEWQRRLGGGGGGGRGAMVHVRARQWATITDSPPPLGEGLGFAAARREDDRFVVGKLRFGAPSLLWGKRRLKNRQIIVLSCNQGSPFRFWTESRHPAETEFRAKFR